jgi:hypothetical protein
VPRPWITTKAAGEKSSNDEEEEREQEIEIFFTAAAGSHETEAASYRVPSSRSSVT